MSIPPPPPATSAHANNNKNATANNKTIHLIRHAQGYHNLRPENSSMHDPLLTPFGLSQCKTLSSTIPPEILSSIDLLSASPLRRTLYTALHVFPSVISRGIKVVALPEAQETGAVPADTGSDLEVLAEEFSGVAVDLDHVREGWNGKVGVWAAEVEAIQERARVVRRWLWERKEEGVVVLVTHGGFLHYLTEDWEGFDPVRGTAWENCEWRTYEISKGDGEVALVETGESRARRRG